MMPDERRNFPRVSAEYRIAFEYFNHRGVKISEGSARTVNISERGALLEMPYGVDLDASLILWILSPFHTLLIKANIVHSRPASNGLFHVGVRLTEVIEGSWELLRKLVQEQQEAEKRDDWTVVL